MKIVQILHKKFIDWKQERLQKQICELNTKWENLSRQCYELEQHLDAGCLKDSVNRDVCESCVRYQFVQDYQKAQFKAKKLKEKIIALEKVKSK